MENEIDAVNVYEDIGDAVTQSHNETQHTQDQDLNLIRRPSAPMWRNYKVFKCHCSKWFATKIQFQAHQYHCSKSEIGADFDSMIGAAFIKKHREASSINIQLQAHQCRRSKNPNWECLICGQTTSSIKSMIEHLTQHYSHEIKFRCPFPTCGKGFFYISSFEQHIKTHYGYKCMQPTCKRRGKRFATRCSLGDHVKIHLWKLKFSCNICPDKRFPKKANLNAHKKTKQHIYRKIWFQMSQNVN